MAKVRDNIRIYGDDPSGVWVAPKGTTGPTALEAPPAGFDELGWLSEDGVDFDQDIDSEDFKAHQGAATVRRKVTGVDRKFTFQCLEETALVLGIAHPGLVFTETAPASGVFRGTVPAGHATVERAWVIDEVDGEVTKRYVAPTGEATLSSAVAHKNDEMTVYEFELTLLGEWDIITNSPTFAAA